jgi:hypothetical protein
MPAGGRPWGVIRETLEMATQQCGRSAAERTISGRSRYSRPVVADGEVDITGQSVRCRSDREGMSR